MAIGALATLYNASCVASTYPDLLAALPNVALQFNLTSNDQKALSPSNLAISGHHYFSNTTTPDFDLNSGGLSLGFAPCLKNNTVAAPAGAPVGQGGQGYGAVAWLKLLTRDGATGNLEEVYRVNTAGGSPPATCAGMPATFEARKHRRLLGTTLTKAAVAPAPLVGVRDLRVLDVDPGDVEGLSGLQPRDEVLRALGLEHLNLAAGLKIPALSRNESVEAGPALILGHVDHA